MEMPLVPLAPLQKSVMASCTGPYGGLCQLEADKDAPSHKPGWCHTVASAVSYMYRLVVCKKLMHVQEFCFSFCLCYGFQGPSSLVPRPHPLMTKGIW